jgi:cytochrome c peroxidase
MNMHETGWPRRYALIIGVVLTVVLCTVSVPAPAESRPAYDPGDELTDIELLGKYIFFDKISTPARMSCATCHDPDTGGTGSVSGVNLHQVAITGANPHTVGNLKPPTNAYATFIEEFHKCNTGGLGRNNYCGGNFWDGRAEGLETALFPAGATKHIGNEIFYATDGAPLGAEAWENAKYFGPVSDQALNPMPNPVEQNIARQAVCQLVKKAKYAPLYNRIWGVDIDCSDVTVTVKAPDVSEEKAFDISYKRLMLAVGAWQGSPDLNSFSSKRDEALRRELDGIDVDDTPGQFPLVGLTDQENLGHDLFYGKVSELNPSGKNANCAACHSDNPAIPFPPPGQPGDTGAEPEQVYSADDYHNIGTPRNPEIPEAYNSDGTVKDPDLGIAGHTGADLVLRPGFFKTPTVRNVDKRKGNGFTKAYTHNGWFKSLESIVHYYNTAFLGGTVPGPGGGATIPYEDTTAYMYGVTRCPPEITTEKDALANNCWPAPAYSGGAPIPFLLGDLKLTADEEAAIVAYMKALTDLHTAKAPKPYKNK